jgi:hypothetical protein
MDAKKMPAACGKTKAELLEVLFREEYGLPLALPTRVTATVVDVRDGHFAGKGNYKKLALTCEAPFGAFTFPVYSVIPTAAGKHPAFVHINFRDAIPDSYQPTEELLDRGFATLTFCYKDVTSDNGDFTDGLAGVLFPDGKREATSPGKLQMWAWAARAVLEYALTLPEIDGDRISVAGHSRLGKTALLAGALDERFYCAFSNDSGCGGAAIARGNTGETVKVITEVFPYWFCPNFANWAGREEEMPFDQHFLIAANLPHRVYVASAKEDLWACPPNEFLACVLASDAYRAAGWEAPLGEFPEVGGCYHGGAVGYHYRSGTHFFSRTDWQYYTDYLKKQFAK